MWLRHLSTSSPKCGFNRGLISAAGPWAVRLALLLALSTTALADTVYLLSGEKLIGKIVTNEKTKVVVKSQALGRMEIARERIERIEFDTPPGVTATNAAPGTPFVPPSPLLLTNPPVVLTNAGAGASSTNARPKRKWFWQRKLPADEASTDWIQLKSGEWLRGRLYGMQNRSLEFESDELDDLKFDWKDVHQVLSPRALVSYGDRESAAGSLRVDRENVTVSGADGEVKFPRYDLIGIAPGSPRELDYWSGRFNVGLNFRSGNTEQADLVNKIKLERRTPRTHLMLEHVGNFSEVSGVETVNNQRATESFDYFLTRRLFVRVPSGEYYHDPFQNIAYRITAGGGLGYYIIDKDKGKVEWLVNGGPAYQLIRFETVQAGEEGERSTPAFAFQSNLDIDLTKRMDLEIGYQAIVANENSGGVTQHGSITLEIDLTRRFDLDISLVWDRIGSPQADSTGIFPQRDDFRLNLSLGVKF
jgi:putative salt-induced outer membrane protein YdiY